MVENRKWFYAISLLLLTCCQITTMFPHNAGISSESNSNSENNNAAAAWHSNSNQNMNSNNNNNYRFNKNKNNDDADSDFLIVAERMPQQQQQEQEQQHHTIVFNMGIWENQDNDSTPADNIDDLIFLDKRPINQQQQQQQHQQQRQEQLHQHHQQQQQQNEQHHHNLEFHHATMDGNSDEEDDTESLTATTYSTMIVVDGDGDGDGDDVDDDDNNNNDGAPHEIELQPDVNEEVTIRHVTPLDLSDFLSLIPAAKVKTIVNHYYRNDPEVQRAHAFMSSREFCTLKQHFIAVPEMSAFLRYLNKSGLDLVKFVTALTNLTSFKGDGMDTQIKTMMLDDRSVLSAMTTEQQIANLAETNDIEYAQKQSNGIMATISNIEIQTETGTTTTATITGKLPPPSPTAFAATTTTATMATIDVVETTTAKEQLNGLHGLVDSILDVLPQDQILATFFDKLEANEQFSKLVDIIGSPEFAKILNNMQNSISLRNLIFTLHNNGIYVIRIVDSLKSYFFLGGF